jgi:hypothetical protein
MAIFKKFDHIGVVVEDLRKAMDALSHFFDLKVREEMEIKDAGIRIAFYPLGSGQMELIEFQKPLAGVAGGLLLSDRGVGSVDRDM